MLRTLRGGKVNTPVMILSGTCEIDTKVKTLGGGADDYMTKPFHKDELVARIHAVVRRSKGHAQSVIRTGDITVNPNAKTLKLTVMSPVRITDCAWPFERRTTAWMRATSSSLWKGLVM